jgi:predicted RND superfamily exporter protein
MAPIDPRDEDAGMLRRPLLACAPVVALTLAAVPFLTGIRVDSSLEVWLDRSRPAYRDYQDFHRTFGSEEFVLLVYPCPAEVDLPFLEGLTDLRFELEEIAGVARVDDLAQAYSRLYALEGVEAFRGDLRGSRLFSSYLISADGRWAATWVHLEAGGDSRELVVAAVEAAIRRAPPAEDVRLAGSPVLNAALNRAAQRAARGLFPLVFALSAAALAVLFRGVSGVVIPFVSVGTAIVWTLALLELSGSSLNMVTVALPPLVWVLGLSTSIHLLARWHRELAEGTPPADAVGRTVRELFKPCLFSALTTALGFASLLASSMRPVRDMGLFAALGILLCFATNFLLFPALIALRLRLRKKLPRFREHHPIFDALARLDRRPRLVVAVTALLGVALAAAIPRLRADANPIEFFRRDAPIAVTYRSVLPGFTGTYSLEIVVTPPAPSGGIGGESTAPSGGIGGGITAVDLDVLRRLDALEQRLEAHDGVARVLSIVDLVELAHRGARGDGRLPGDDASLADARGALAEHAEELAAFEAGGELRLSVLARPMGSTAHQRLVEDVRGLLAREVDPSWRPRLTGIVPLLVDMQERLVDSQVRTFSLAFLMIMAVLGLLLRSLRYALLSLLPNLLPIVFALGTMGWLDLALDPATVMIAGVALGIAVDDAIHFLVCYRRRRRAGRDREKAVEETLHAVGRPMVITSLVAALGFLVLGFSDFVPLIRFGLLTALTMGAALVGDLVLLPALLVIRPRRDRTSRLQ